MNLCWIDLETTGLDERKHDVIQLACIPVINGVRQKAFNEFCQPSNWDTIEQEALNVHGISREQLATFQSQEQMLNNFIAYVSSFNTRFGIAGHNVAFFDKRFLSTLFKNYNKNNAFFALFNLTVHDTLVRARSLKGVLKTENNKLETLANHFNIEIQAHDALSDISANIDVDRELAKILQESTELYKPSIDKNNIEINEKLPEPMQLHLHSQYSMAGAIPTPEDWAKWCEENDVPGFSVVDHGYAISLFQVANNKSKVVSIPGACLNFKFNLEDEDFYHLNIWGVNTAGYFNVMKLTSLGWDSFITHDKKDIPIITFQQILDHREGLKFGTADIEGYVGKAIIEGKAEIAELRYKQLIQSFGNDLYIEFNPIDITHYYDKKIGFKPVSSNAIITDNNSQKAYNNFLFSMLQYGGKPIPVSGACFIDHDDKILQDCICKNNNKDGKFFQESYHAKTANTLYKELKVHLHDKDFDICVFKEWIQNTMEFHKSATDISVSFKYHLAEIEIPEHIKTQTSSYDEQLYLYTLERIKKHGRWNNSDKYRERFLKELDVIAKNKAMNFLPYFLMYDDFGEFARNQGFLQNIARGSAGGSLLSYYLKIIHVDPVDKDIPFERFLSHARINAGSWPDIDMDISKSARPHLMRYMKQKYGSGFAQVATFSTMKTKNAIKDTMKALYGRNRKDFEVEAVCKSIPDSPQGVSEANFLYGYEDKEGHYHEGQLDTNQHLQTFFELYPDVASVVKRLIGVVRGLSRHASAFVVSTLDLPAERVPTLTMYDKGMGENIHVTQYDASMCEKSELVKADVLGLKTLSVVTDALKLIEDVDYREPDENGMNLIYRLPEDEQVYANFYNKKTDSSFQFNTPVVKASIQNFIPTERKHLSALTALLRPGAMDAKMTSIDGCDNMSATEYYMQVRSGTRQVEYIHPDLEYILKDSNGVFCFQEEIMQFLVEIVGYTLEESDQIRAAIAKKKHDVMMAAFDRIRAATAARGWSNEQQEAICNVIMAFSRYSFNKSHSHAYAELGYITMYLKHYHKLEWWAAVLNNEDNEDKLRHYISILGDLIKPPSMKSPMERFTINGEYIVAPISVIKGVGPKTYNELTEKGPFTDIQDYCNRVDHRKADIGAVSMLIMARAADDFMDKTLDYVSARFKFMDDYKKARGNIKTNFKPELIAKDPLDILLLEKKANTAFNKSVLSEPDLMNLILSKWKGLQQTGRKGIPLMLNGIPILTNVNVAVGLLEKNYEKDIGMILLCEKSAVRKGISKRTGKPYCFVSTTLNDGFMDVEATDWNAKIAYKFPKNSLVYVRGEIKQGWKAPICINIKEIELIE